MLHTAGHSDHRPQTVYHTDTWSHGHMVTDLCVEDREGLRRVERDENPDQELLVFSLQGQSEAVDDAKRRRVTRQHRMKVQNSLSLFVFC